MAREPTAMSGGFYVRLEHYATPSGGATAACGRGDCRCREGQHREHYRAGPSPSRSPIRLDNGAGHTYAPPHALSTRSRFWAMAPPRGDGWMTKTALVPTSPPRCSPRDCGGG